MGSETKESEMVIVPFGAEYLALSMDEYSRARMRGGQMILTPREPGALPSGTQKRYVTAEVMSERTGAPVTWFYEKARKKEIPFVRLGKYVRFDEEEVLAFLKKSSKINREPNGLRS